MQRDRNPRWRRVKSGPFHRIGDTYGHFINPEHFMGRSAFDDSWLVPEILSNVKKGEEHYEIEMALPGFQKEDITVTVEGSLLKVSADRHDEDQEYEFVRKEVPFDVLKRNFQLEKDANREGIKAIYENGILKISIPHNGKKTAEESKRVLVS